MKTMQKLILFLIALPILSLFQNCGKYDFDQTPTSVVSSAADVNNPDLAICQGVSCTLTPITTKAAATTFLVNFSSDIDSQLKQAGASARFLAETIVRYTSPVDNPKILVVRDHYLHGQSDQDIAFVVGLLKLSYKVDYLIEGPNGLSPNQIAGYDLIWFTNPGGYPMSSPTTLNTLTSFQGGVVLEGDDMSWGATPDPNDPDGFDLAHSIKFDLSHLTGLSSQLGLSGTATTDDANARIANGQTILCNGSEISPGVYRVGLDPTKFPGVPAAALEFGYGADIDLTTAASANVNSLASALPAAGVACQVSRPVIVRNFK